MSTVRSAPTWSVVTSAFQLLLVFVVGGCDDPSVATRRQIQVNKQVDQAIDQFLDTSSSVEARNWRDFKGHFPGAHKQVGYAWDESVGVFKGGVDATAVVHGRYL